jgi:ComF family protein
MSLTRTTSRLFDSALSLLYPHGCEVCKGLVSARADGIACDSCWSKVQFFNQSDIICWKCGSLSLGIEAPVDRTSVRCRRCDDDAFAAARACGVYEGALRAAVLSLKREPRICSRLLRVLCETQSRPPLNLTTRIVPIPLHLERERIRGFNQAAVIGRELARRVGLTFDDRSVIRTRHSERHRAGMDARGRRDSVAAAFEVCQPLVVSGERVLLVDDVFTTGATVSSCASALLAAGAAEVTVLTLARTQR